MRNEVTIDGVTLTRAQIEQAKAELDRSIEVKWKAGDFVRWKYCASPVFVVVHPNVAKVFKKRWPWRASDGRSIQLLSLHDGSAYSEKPECLERSGVWVKHATEEGLQ